MVTGNTVLTSKSIYKFNFSFRKILGDLPAKKRSKQSGLRMTHGLWNVLTHSLSGLTWRHLKSQGEKRREQQNKLQNCAN